MKRDLLALGQVSRLFMGEYRSFQAARIAPFVRIEELPGFLNAFYPVTDPLDPASINYSGRALTVVLPWDVVTTWDIMPLLDLMDRSWPSIRAHWWAVDFMVPPPALPHWKHICHLIMGPNLLQPGGQPGLLHYIHVGTEPRIAEIKIRSDGHPQPTHRAKAEIWFEDAEGVDWMDGEDWAWPHARATRSLANSTEIQNFINASGLQQPYIRMHWEVRLGVLGRHAVGGRNV
jgi:hypothetical protein